MTSKTLLLVDAGTTLLPAVVRTSAAVAILGYASIGYFGLVVIGPAAVAAVLVPGAAAAAAVGGMLVSRGDRTLTARRLLPAALIGAGSLPFAAGASSLGAAAIGPILVTMACAGIRILGQGFLADGAGGTATSDRRPDQPPATDDEPTAGLAGAVLMADPRTRGSFASPDAWASPVLDDEDVLRAALRAASLQQVFRQWGSTTLELAANDAGPRPERRLVAIRLRELLLEEMERRDPDGVQRWLVEGPVDRPHRYVRGDRDVGA